MADARERPDGRPDAPDPVSRLGHAAVTGPASTFRLDKQAKRSLSTKTWLFLVICGVVIVAGLVVLQLAFGRWLVTGVFAGIAFLAMLAVVNFLVLAGGGEALESRPPGEAGRRP